MQLESEEGEPPRSPRTPRKKAFEPVSVADRPWYQKWSTQCKLLLWKNWRLSIRKMRATIVQILTPIIFIFALWVLQKSLEGNQLFYDFYDSVHSPEDERILDIPLCSTGEQDFCYTFVYAPDNDSEVDEVVERIRLQNNPVIPESSVRAFPNADAVDNFIFQNLNTTQGAYIFAFDGAPGDVGRNLSFTLQLNVSSAFWHGKEILQARYIYAPMSFAVERAILQQATKDTTEATLDINLIPFAHPEVLTTNVIGSNGPGWFFAVLMFNFVAGLGSIVMEKEMKLREIMKIMGLYDSAYWFTWFLTLSVYMTLTVFVLIAAGAAFQFNFFLKNDFGLYFFTLWLFGFTTVSMSFLVSTIVKKSSNATTVGFLVFILGYFLQIGGSIIYSEAADLYLRVIFSLFSPTIFAIALIDLGAATEKSEYPGLRWSIRNDSAATPNGLISYNEMYGWLVLDFFIYLLIALYLDNVVPSEYGTSRPWYYFVTPSYWSGKAKPRSKKVKKIPTDPTDLVTDEDVKLENDRIRSNKLGAETAVQIRDLVKIYPRESKKKCCGPKPEPYHAVNGLCLGIEADSLLCLLGPNGAGKTTTIHMLVGFHEATSGDATVFGHSVTDNISQVQQLMGVCPQFDILWPELTGAEHLWLFSGLRGLRKDEVPVEVERLLKAVELQSASDVRSVSYSGGMRRRLSVAIALIGNPKIVFLDEPTTGMDPISRRKVWNIIEAEKKDKVIILTTHSMEEADILGDKIAIMAKGSLQCVGTSLHLKQKFGSGYRITIGSSVEKTEAVKAFFKDNIKGAELSGAAVGGYATFAIPRESTSDLVPFFRKLEQTRETLEIKDVQLSLTTLEEVFLSIAENAELKHLQKKINDDAKKDEKKKKKKKDVEDEGKDVESQINEVRQKDGSLRYSRRKQFKALFIKSATLQLRDKKTIACQTLTPLVLVALLFGLSILINSLIDSDPIDEVIHPPITGSFGLLSVPDDREVYEYFFQPNPILPNLIANGSRMFYTSEPGVDAGDYESGVGVLGNMDPNFGGNFSIKFNRFNPFGQLINQTFNRPSLPTKMNVVEFATRQSLNDEMYYIHDHELPTVWGGYHFKELDFTNQEFRFGVFYNRSIGLWVDTPYLIDRIVRSIGISLTNPVNIQMVGVKTFPTIKDEKGFTLDLVTLAGPFFYMLILLQLLPVILSNIVYEKEAKIREMMTMMGLSMNIYWLVQYVFSYLLYLGVMMVLIIAGVIFRFRIFTINAFGSYFILFFLWGHVLVALCFLLQCLFSSRKTALIFGYFSVLVGSLICNVLIDNILGDYENVQQSMALGLSVIPPFCLYRGLMYLSSEVSWNGPGFRMSGLANEPVNIASCYGFLVWEWFAIMLAWWYLEQVLPSGWGIKKHPLFFLGFKKHHAKDDLINDDYQGPVDVEAERQKVFVKVPNDDLGIQVLNIRKVYPAADGNPPKIAVKGASFGVENCSSFGILGHNGAGKTSLIHMLIGLFPPSSGTAYVQNYNLQDQMDSIHTFMGICPQHDVLWGALTAEEHLLFYGRIKNLSGKVLKERIKYVLQRVNLYDVRNKQAQTFSGGMKRRLSVAISIIGRPKVLYLDEPSTGLDPKSRQDLWGVINEAKSHAAVILTTHSMEEADAICDRLMIMADGEIKCIGVSADLKNRFGEGFKLSVQVERGYSPKPAHKFVKKLVPDAVKINELAGTANFQVPKTSISLEQAFQEMEAHKDELHITDWAITNTTLEEVFLRISEGSKTHEPEGRKKKAGKSVSNTELSPKNAASKLEIAVDAETPKKSKRDEEFDLQELNPDED
eukprot:TRINITY_DN2300_c0_g1_i1.p1 TRINITY_DN2300_c0_g1~~TRINITY_DN2300_c0_g1_i1.p1  ORF type:complete len:1800 (+),score=493.64 TRINITY_DN2300_c0_g1_i1:225-5624(+)